MRQLLNSLSEKLKPDYVRIGEKTRTGWEFDDGFNPITDRQAQIFAPLDDEVLTLTEVTQEEETMSEVTEQMTDDLHDPMNPNAVDLDEVEIETPLTMIERVAAAEAVITVLIKRVYLLEAQLGLETE